MPPLNPAATIYFAESPDCVSVGACRWDVARLGIFIAEPNMSNQTNRPHFGDLSPDDLKPIIERSITRLLVVFLECLVPRKSAGRRIVKDIRDVVAELSDALKRMTKS